MAESLKGELAIKEAIEAEKLKEVREQQQKIKESMEKYMEDSKLKRQIEDEEYEQQQREREL